MGLEDDVDEDQRLIRKSVGTYELIGPTSLHFGELQCWKQEVLQKFDNGKRFSLKPRNPKANFQTTKALVLVNVICTI
jgi:hypothetical protein